MFKNWNMLVPNNYIIGIESLIVISFVILKVNKLLVRLMDVGEFYLRKLPLCLSYNKHRHQLDSGGHTNFQLVLIRYLLCGIVYSI